MAYYCFTHNIPFLVLFFNDKGPGARLVDHLGVSVVSVSYEADPASMRMQRSQKATKRNERISQKMTHFPARAAKIFFTNKTREIDRSNFWYFNIVVKTRLKITIWNG